MGEIRVTFRHGLGDCVHFAHLLQLYMQCGYIVHLHGEENKRFVWEVAGTVPADGTLTSEVVWGYPAEFEDLLAPDHIANKVAHGINHPPLPDLGDSEELWEELCRVRLSAKHLLPVAARQEAEAFLRDLPRPVILLHTHGTNWARRKNLSADLTLQLIRELLAASPGSIIVLDWDARAPMVGHERVKGIRPSWGMIDPARLATLYEQADLLIGVDSGPFHWAAVTNIRALGIFREIHPCRCCLPNPNATYLVSRRHHDQWVRRAERWRLTEYAGSEPCADEIVKAALPMLAGQWPRQVQAVPLEPYAGRYLYRRVGYDERPLGLNADGRIAEGSAGCEQFWALTDAPGPPRLTIYGGFLPTCHLELGHDGVWRGQWLRHEQMPIELIPHRRNA